MALLDLLPRPGEPLDPRLLTRAYGEGRVRGIAAELDAAARTEPLRAGGVLRRGLRDARALHSRERRLVSDALYDGFRWGPTLEAATGLSGFDGRWAGWLLLHGLEPDAVAGLDRARWQALVDGTLALSGPVLAGGAEVWDSLVGELGEDRATALIAASNQRAEVQIRANRARIDRDALRARLAAEGIASEPCRWAPDGLVVRGRANLLGSKLYTAGLFEVQDEGSQLLAGLVEATGTVVDLCAGAGGKSLAMAASGARVEAFDVRPRPLTELSKRAERAGLAIRTHRLHPDGSLPDEADAALRGRADRVLVDAPCSGSGTWRRHPELRARLAQLDDTRALQAAILDRAAALVRPGGRLVYGTCSALPSENRGQVDAFLARHPEFALRPLDRPELGGDVLSLAPDTHGTDGFFGAVLVKGEG